MGDWHLVIDDSIGDEFREIAFRYMGRKKGYLTNAVEEAMRLWLDHKKKQEHQGSERQKKK